MSRSPSLIDPVALANALARAGVPVAGRPTPPKPTSHSGSHADDDLGAFSHLPPEVSGSTTQTGQNHRDGHVGQAATTSGNDKIPDLPAIFLEASGNPSAASNRLDTRLEGYMDWVEQCSRCSGVFVVDEEGLVLMEKNSDPTLVALSAYFLRFQDRIRSLESQIRGSIAIDLEGEQILYVVQADTHLGLHALGFTVTEPMMPGLIQRFQTALPYVFHKVSQ